MLLQAWYVILLCVTLFVLARRHWSKRRARARGHAPVPIATSTRLAQDITREVLALEPRGSHRQHRRVPMDFPKVRILLQQIERYLPEQLKERAHLWLGNDHELPVEPHEALRGAGAAGDWWPELLIGLAGEPRFAGSGTDADDQFTPGADAAELLGRVQEILAACKDPRMHEALDGLSIRCVLEKAPHHFVWFAEAPGSPVPFVVSETVIQTTLPIDAVVWSIYSPEERLKWDKSPFVAHEILHPGGVQSRAFRDFLYSRVTIAPGISDRDLVQERFLTRLPDQSGYAILMSSCSDEIAASLGRPDSTDVVRTKDLLSAYILKPCEHGILLTTLSQKDVGSHVPSFFQHMARSVGKRKPLEMAQKFLLKHNCACPNACPAETPIHTGPTMGPANDWKTVAMPIIVSASVIFFIFVAAIAIKQLISRRRRPHEGTPLIHGGDDHTAGALSHTEESAGGDEEYFTPPSTMTSMQNEPLTDPTVAFQNNNTNKQIQGSVRKGSHETEEAKV